MKNKLYTAIGLMSGTSMDGVDASLIRSNGIDEFTNILDKYYEYDDSLHQELIDLRNLILVDEDLRKYSNRLSELEREIRESPSDWLWSHKRWKHSRPEGMIVQERRFECKLDA
mgnify:CR=1 FL=1